MHIIRLINLSFLPQFIKIEIEIQTFFSLIYLSFPFSTCRSTREAYNPHTAQNFIDSSPSAAVAFLQGKREIEKGIHP